MTKTQQEIRAGLIDLKNWQPNLRLVSRLTGHSVSTVYVEWQKLKQGK